MGYYCCADEVKVGSEGGAEGVATLVDGGGGGSSSWARAPGEGPGSAAAAAGRSGREDEDGVGLWGKAQRAAGAEEEEGEWIGAEAEWVDKGARLSGTGRPQSVED